MTFNELLLLLRINKYKISYVNSCDPPGYEIKYTLIEHKFILFIKNKVLCHEKIHTYYREDKNFWETKFKLFRFIDYYKYVTWRNGKTIKRFRLFYPYKNPVYIKGAHDISERYYVGKKEFEDVYKNNKWIILVNLKLRLDLP